MDSKKTVKSLFCKPYKRGLQTLAIVMFIAATCHLGYSFYKSHSTYTNRQLATQPNASPLFLENDILDNSLNSLSEFANTGQIKDHLHISSNNNAHDISNASGLNSFFAYNEDRGPLDFSLHVIGPGNGPTLFVVGGIQGDEPGAFSAASLLVTHYEITKGRLIVVPNLNFQSIIKRDRGPNGDMNRKFAALSKNDPEYETVTKIKNLLLNPHVDAILNMHDGSGFYRPSWEDPMRNPKRWGQSVIIDQTSIGDNSYCQLEEVAEHVLGRTNTQLLSPEHKYYLKNTHTAEGDKEMEKTLTYFAITNGKPAFGVEASKNFSLPVRAYYHIQVLESFMEHMGIEFKRKFDPTPEGLALALGSDLALTFPDSKLTMLLDDMRGNISHFPMRKGQEIKFVSSSPLITVVPKAQNSSELMVYYGNRPVSSIKPDYMEFDNSLPEIELKVDGKDNVIAWGEVIHVSDSVLVKSIPGYRVNAIGAQVNNGASECNYNLKQSDFQNRFSVDKAGSTYRVEIYKQTKQGTKDPFVGMFLIKFPVNTAQRNTPLLPAVEGKETLLGY